VVWDAIALDEPLRAVLVFKGARALGQLLPSLPRESLDLDASLSGPLGAGLEPPQATAAQLQQMLERAIRRQVEALDPRIYQLDRVVVQPSPLGGHPFGRQGYAVTIALRDLRRPGLLGTPNIRLDISALEDLGTDALEELRRGEGTVRVYSVTRQAAEKLRALLESLPRHRAKIGATSIKPVRVKDIADICRIVDLQPLTDLLFWEGVASEFRRACRSRFVDCEGWETFEQDVPVTRRSYLDDATLREERPFEEAWAVLGEVVSLIGGLGMIPFFHPLPSGSTTTAE